MKTLDEHLPEDLQGFNIAIAGTEPAGKTSNSSKDGEKSSGDGLAGTDAVDDSSSKEQEPHKKGEKSMADTEKVDVRKEVEALMAEKDAKASIEKRISELEVAKADLAQQLADANTAKDTISSELETAKADLSSKTQECEALVIEKDDSIAKAADAEKQLDEIRAEQSLASRTSKLEEASLLLTEGEKRDKQLDKVKAMSDEDFEGYVVEMADIKGLAGTTASDDDADKDDDKDAKDDKADANTDSDDKKDDAKKADASVAPADVGDGKKFAGAIASASANVSLDDDKVETYACM